MDLRRKLTVLADAAKYDASCSSAGSKRATREGGLGSTDGMGICHSYTPDGRCVSLLKLLLTNVCIYDCKYCVNRVSSDVERARFTPREVVELTLDFYRRNYIEGLFLSSGIVKNADFTMEQLVSVARSLREEHRFDGYIHLKTAPGASPELLDLAGRYADRLSVNIELPTPADLATLAPEKNGSLIEKTMGAIRERVAEAREESAKSARAPSFAPAGQTTQMIVGASGTSDTEILVTSSRLYREQRLRRVYYSAFSPIPQADTRLPLVAPPLVREHRLYQADWLVRFYGFRADELTTEASPNLALDKDPKLAWALRNPGYFPVDVNRAPREVLLRVPGLGVRNVERLLESRRFGRVTLAHLAKLRVSVEKVSPFVLTADHNPDRLRVQPAKKARAQKGVQLGLFERLDQRAAG